MSGAQAVFKTHLYGPLTPLVMHLKPPHWKKSYLKPKPLQRDLYDKVQILLNYSTNEEFLQIPEF
jgi:hypothetical protein